MPRVQSYVPGSDSCRQYRTRHCNIRLFLWLGGWSLRSVARLLQAQSRGRAIYKKQQHVLSFTKSSYLGVSSSSPPTAYPTLPGSNPRLLWVTWQKITTRRAYGFLGGLHGFALDHLSLGAVQVSFNTLLFLA
jgi:hypothetical protein